MLPSVLHEKFFTVLEQTEHNIASFVKNPGADMTRHRRCTFQKTILAILSFSSNCTKTDIHNFFGISKGVPPTRSAFVQQRQKFSPSLFPHILREFNSAVPFEKTYRGFHLAAIDGSDLNLPTNKNDMVYRVKQARSNSYYYQMHINALFDICENRYITAVTQPRPQMNESAAFQEMISQCQLPDNTIYIADRGYANYNNLAFMFENNKYFLFRAKSPASSGSFLKHLAQADVESDRFVTLGVTRSKKKIYAKNPRRYKSIHPKRAFDPLPEHDKTSVYDMTFRITAVKLKDGYEYLVSNLPMELFSAYDLKCLYWKRWHIETSFRRLKYALSLVYLHSVKRELILQEVYAKLIMYNFVSVLHAYGEEKRRNRNKKRKRETKYKYKVSFDNIGPIARDFFKEYVSDDIIKALLLRDQTPMRKDINNNRKIKSQTVRPLSNRA